HARVAAEGLDHVHGLSVMDAEHLAFPDGTFDVVVAQYVITAVPHPEATLDEFARVLKARGEIVLVNHIGAETGFRRAFQAGFAPVARRLRRPAGVPCAALHGRAPSGDPPDRASPHAAARPFLPDPLRQAGGQPRWQRQRRGAPVACGLSDRATCSILPWRALDAPKKGRAHAGGVWAVKAARI